MDQGQELGRYIGNEPAAVPSNATPLVGRYVTLEGIRKEHMPSLFSNLSLPHDQSVFDWLPWTDPTDTEDELWQIFEKLRKARGFIVYAIIADPHHLNPPLGVVKSKQNAEVEVLGTIGYLDINAQFRTLEAGVVLFGQALRRTVAATEAFYLILRNVCDPSNSPPYRRVAWKCNHFNTASRRAAERLGFVYEGTLRNHMISKSRSRDSDSLSIVESEWPVVEEALRTWLEDQNFDERGRQLKTLDEIRSAVTKRRAA